MLYPVAGSISAAKRWGNTAPKKYRSGGEPFATLCDRVGYQTLDFLTESDVAITPIGQSAW